MAMSLSRPDPSSPASVSAAVFASTRRGFDQGEVRDFLRMVAAELARLQEREKQLERELRTAQRNVPHAAVVLDDEVVTRMLGEEAARILQTARDAATQIKVRAEENAARLLREATDEAQRRREEAEIESSRRRQDASADAEAELQMAKQQGREMVNEARAYRERVLSELSRRRELARQQIEQLVHGRDRLLQAFERARIAAVDVMAELTPLGEPSEYVNLAPTTGPVPLMVPGGSRPGEAPALPADLVPPPATGHAVPGVVATPSDETADDEALVTADTDEATADRTADDPLDDDGAAAVGDDHLADVDDELVEPIEADDEFAAPADADADLAEAEAGFDAEAAADDAEAAADDAEAAADAEVVAGVVEVVEAIEADIDEPADAEVEAGDDDEDDDGVVLAPVVALFAGEIDLPPTDDRADDPAADWEADDLDASTSEASATPRATVDDLFARLRAARTDAVVQRTREAIEPEAVTADAAESDRPAATAAPEPAAPAAPTDDTVVLSVFARSPEAPVVVADDDDSPFAAREAVLTPLIVAGARKLKRVLADEQNDVLHSLRRGQGVQVPKAADHVDRYAQAIEEELRDAAMAGAASISGRDAIDIVAAIRPAVAALADTLVDPLRERLDRAVVATDGDADDLTEHVRSIYREWKTQRIDEHFDDVVRIAFGHGALASLAPGTPVCWAVDPNGPACPDADDNALGGVVPSGQPFPTDHLCAPAHPGCRCLLVRAPR